MKKRRVITPAVAEPPPKSYSNCTVVGNQVFVSGMTARGPDGLVGGDSMYEQTRAVFDKIKAFIAAAGGSMDDVVKVTVFVTDIKRRDEIWKARAEYFTGDFPASTLVEISALASPDLLVEIEAIAFIGCA